MLQNIATIYEHSIAYYNLTQDFKKLNQDTWEILPKLNKQKKKRSQLFEVS